MKSSQNSEYLGVLCAVAVIAYYSSCLATAAHALPENFSETENSQRRASQRLRGEPGKEDATVCQKSSGVRSAENLNKSPGISRVLRVDDRNNRVPEKYIIVLKQECNASADDILTLALSTIQARSARVADVLSSQFSTAIRGFGARLTDAQLEHVRRDPCVDYIHEDAYVQSSASEPAYSWGIDRVDQRNGPIDNHYNFSATGAGVNIYILDNGVDVSHPQYRNRAAQLFDFFNEDLHGHPHGTHVAGIAAGRSYGIARHADIWSVKIYPKSGDGTLESFLAGLDAIAAFGRQPGVINMSLRFPQVVLPIQQAVDMVVALGFTVVAAAGNDQVDACLASPAFVPSAITVSSVDQSLGRSTFSNYGPCLDLYAPGRNVLSSLPNSRSGLLSGTSMAAPHVSGAAALYLESNRGASAAVVTDAILTAATAGVVLNNVDGSPNKFLYTRVAFDACTDRHASCLECVADKDCGWSDSHGSGGACLTASVRGDARVGNTRHWKYLLKECPYSHILNAGEVVKSGQSILNRDFSGRLVWLTLQQDGNLVLYHNGVLRWATNTTSACILSMQGDCSLALFDRGGAVVWTSNNSSQGGACFAVLQRDGDLVLYDAWLSPTWSTDTSISSNDHASRHGKESDAVSLPSPCCTEA